LSSRSLFRNLFFFPWEPVHLKLSRLSRPFYSVPPTSELFGRLVFYSFPSPQVTPTSRSAPRTHNHHSFSFHTPIPVPPSFIFYELPPLENSPHTPQWFHPGLPRPVPVFLAPQQTCRVPTNFESSALLFLKTDWTLRSVSPLLFTALLKRTFPPPGLAPFPLFFPSPF